MRSKQAVSTRESSPSNSDKDITLTNEKKKDLVIVGGGAAGLFAALMAARKGLSVLVLEQKERTGKKILITGNGRCNLGNLSASPESYPAPMRNFTAPALDALPVNRLIRDFASIGIPVKARGDYLYPRSDQAVSVADALALSAREAGAVIMTETKVTRIERKYGGFQIFTSEKSFTAETVLIACGSKAAPKTGSDGSGYQLLKELGIPVRKVLPALTPLVCDEPLAKVWAGVRTSCHVTIISGDREMSDTGEIQLTDYGISGIPVFQVSRMAVQELAAGNKVQAVLNFLPEYEENELSAFVREGMSGGRNRTIEQFLEGLLPKKVIRVLARRLDISEKEPVGRLGGKTVQSVLDLARCFRLAVTGYKDFAQAQVCQGGAALDAVYPDSLMAKKIPGLFLAGEILDVDGPCGGFNLTWAWASGNLAALSAASYLEGRERK